MKNKNGLKTLLKMKKKKGKKGNKNSFYFATFHSETLYYIELSTRAKHFINNFAMIK